MNNYQRIKCINNMIEENRQWHFEESLHKKAIINFYKHFDNTSKEIQKKFMNRPSKKRLFILQEENKKLKCLVNKLENNIENYEQETTNLQAKIDEQIKSQTNERFCLNILKENTNVFLNAKALPTAIRGFSVRDVDKNNQWKPFNFPIGNFTEEQISEQFWTTIANSSENRQQWEELILGTSNLV